MTTNAEKMVPEKRYFIETYGCQMNEEDSEKLAGFLKGMGYIKADTTADADLIIFNTCCVREHAELKVYGNLGRLKKLKAKKPSLIIAVCGCMMQQTGIPEGIKKRFPFVDIIFGTYNIHRFPELLHNFIQSNSRIMEIWDKEGKIVEGIPIERESGIKAFVTIMHGCNNFCTYCIVPYTRGRERSRTPDAIIKEISELAAKGYKEITLLGQNVNSYGKDLENMNFAKLLRMVNEVPGIERIRFMTSHPKDLTDDVIYAIRDCDKVCEQVHLPVQSGSSRILKLMNRKYSKEDYLKLIEKIKDTIPGIAITTDIIVGFPGETEEDFNETLDLIRKVEFDSAFTFIYSKRKGTPAEKLENQIPEEVKHDRFNRLVDMVNLYCEKNNKKYQDRVVELLVECRSKTDDTRLTGHTRTGKIIHFTGGNDSLIGHLVNVRVTEPQSFILLGEYVDVVK